MVQADFNKIALVYDLGHVNVTDVWIKLIAKKIGKKSKVTFLDLGCGTGRYALPIAQELGYEVTGADNAENMLEKAREKDTKQEVFWDLQDAVSLTYPDNFFDAVFMSSLLHHIEDPARLLKECRRILKSGGVLMNRTGTIENNSNDPDHVFFPEVMDIDKKRIPTQSQIEGWLATAEFKKINSHVIEQVSYKTPQERVEKTKARSKSALTLISDEAFAEGITKLGKYTQSHPSDRWLLTDKITFTTGIVEK